jgi:hypothetical protein
VYCSCVGYTVNKPHDQVYKGAFILELSTNVNKNELRRANFLYDNMLSKNENYKTEKVRLSEGPFFKYLTQKLILQKTAQIKKYIF